jgi:hypothetical protein
VRRHVTLRELFTDAGEIGRKFERDESFVVTRDDVPVGELSPVRRRQFVPAAAVLEAFSGAVPNDPARFRSDIDRALDHSIVPVP